MARMFRHEAPILALVLSTLVLSCTTAEPNIDVALPARLGLATLPLEQRTLLRVTVGLEGLLAETELALSDDLGRASGRFSLPEGEARQTSLSLRLYGRFSANTPEVVLARLDATITVEAEGPTTPVLSDSWRSDDDLIFDANRNGESNLGDLLSGIDPAPPPPFIAVAPSTLQLVSSTPSDLQRQVVAVENRSSRAVVAVARVLDAPGVYITTVDSSAKDERLRRAIDLGTIPAFARRFLSVSFVPPSSYFSTGAVLIEARDPVSGVVQSTDVTLIGNASGVLQPVPVGDVVLPQPSFDYAGVIVPFPRRELYNGLPISSVDPAAEPPEPLDFHGWTLGGFPADAAYYVSVPPAHRFFTWLSGLNADLDVTLLPIDDAGNLDLDNAVRPALSGTSPESIEWPFASTPRRLLLLLGVVEPTRSAASLVDLPFSLVAHVVAGPEFAAVDPVVPREGSTAGGTSVLIQGSGFAPGARVFFEGAEGSDVSVSSDGSSLTCATPALANAPEGSAAVTVEIRNPALTGENSTLMLLPRGFVYLPPEPSLTSAQPSQISVLGGTPVRLAGAHLSGDDRAPRVFFGDNQAAAVTWLADDALLAIAPPGAAGAVDVSVETEFLTGTVLSSTAPALVTYLEPTSTAPVLSDLSTETVASAGGDEVILVGDNFVDGAQVFFGGVLATSVSFVDAQTLLTETPAQPPSFVDVTVINPDGQTATLPLALRIVSSCIAQGNGCTACGNAAIDPGEQCDGSLLNDRACSDMGFDGGDLGCSAQCFYDLSDCTRCGNGGVEPGEDCEEGDLAGMDCLDLGFVAGTLACDSTCVFDATACNNCGDAICAADETHALCATDCAVSCGDDICGGAETCLSCPHDCSCFTPFSLVRAAGDGISTQIGQTAATGLLVQVLDANSDPLGGVRVVFDAEPGVLLANTESTTNVSGNAATGYNAGLVPGTYDIVAEGFLPDNSSIGTTTFTVNVTDVAQGTILTVLNRNRTAATGLGNAFGPSVPLNQPLGVAIDGEDNVYVADSTNHRVLKMTRYGAVTLYAGTGSAGAAVDGGLATQSALSAPRGLAMDEDGLLLIADTANNRIRRVESDGTISTFAGGGVGGDGSLATNAALVAPQQIAVDSNGVVYFTEFSTPDYKIRRIGVDQTVATLLDTSVTTVPYQAFTGIAVSNDTLMVGAQGKSGQPYQSRGFIGRYNGTDLTAVAGTTSATTVVDAGAFEVYLAGAPRPATGTDGTLLVATGTAPRVWQLNRGNYFTRRSGTGTAAFAGDYVVATAADHASIFTLAMNSVGDIYVVENTSNCIRMIRGGETTVTPWVPTITTEGESQTVSPAQQLTIPARMRVVGPSGPVASVRVSFSVDRPGAFLATPNATTDGTGWAQTAVFAGRRQLLHTVTATYTIFDGEVVSRAIPMTTPTLTPGTILTVVNTIGQASGAPTSGPSSQMRLYNPLGVALDADNNLYVQGGNQTPGGVRVDAEGVGTLLNGVTGLQYTNSTSETAVGPSGQYYFSFDQGGSVTNAITRVLIPPNTVSPYVGDGSTGCTGTSPLTATFSNVRGMATDSTGQLYLSDSSCNSVRVVDAAATLLSTVVSGACTASQPVTSHGGGVAVGPSDELYYAGNVSTCAGSAGLTAGGVVMRVDGPGVFTRVAGGGSATGEGVSALTASITPTHIEVGPDGVLYIVETGSHRIRKVEGGIITTLVGTGVAGLPAGVQSLATAQLSSPEEIAFGPDGNLYIADLGNQVVRMVVLP